MKVEALLKEIEEFNKALAEHYDLWSRSLDDTVPDYPIQNQDALRDQSKQLSRKFGTIQPYLTRFNNNWVVVNSATGFRWNALEVAVGMNNSAIIKGQSIRFVEQKINTIIGRLQAMDPRDEVPEDIAEPIRSEASASDLMSERDALTQLWTRGKLDSELPQNITEAAASKQPLSLIMVDIDHFKNVNDSYGHPKGDTVLAGVAACIASVVAGKGRVYRYGGEEILVVLMNHDVQEATAVAERARRELESQRIADISVTASFGVGTFPVHGSSSEEVIEAADKAMYDAKDRGRNLVRIFGEPAPKPDKIREPERKLPPPGVLTD